jgi:hypothetical protein
VRAPDVDAQVELSSVAVLEIGDPIPDATVWVAPRTPQQLAQVFDGRAALLAFYLFDWSST